MKRLNSRGAMLYLRADGIILISALIMIRLSAYVAGELETPDPGPPIPDVALTKLFPKANFHTALYAMWEPDHAAVSQDQSTVTLMLDHVSGCGIKSIEKYYHGFFSASIRLPGSYSAGVVTTFYMSNNQDYPDDHDEFDFEFLGTIPGEPYTIQTNAYGAGRTDLGREQRFRLWFDPTTEFHDYSFLWDVNHTVFFVDNIPIWEFPKMEGMGVTYPSKQMSIYSTIWDASRWATDGGRYQVDYTYQPFVATYSNFIINGCSEINPSDSPDGCPPIFNEAIPPGLTKAQLHALDWVQSNHRFYAYCLDYDRYPDISSLPECAEERARALSSPKPVYPEGTFFHFPAHSKLQMRP